MSEKQKAGGSGGASTKDLNRVLGKGDLFGMAVGQIIGAGIMSLTGVAIGMTGRSVPVAFMLAALFVVVTASISVFVGGTVRMRGGMYTQIALLVGQKFAGIYIIVFIFTNLSIAMYALSFADYFMGLVGLPTTMRQLVAAGVVTLFYVLNILGVEAAAKIQNLIVLLLCLALAVFSGFGIFNIRPDYFVMDGYFSGGIVGLVSAAALLTFATGGATVVVNLSAECKDPVKDIPFVIIVSTICVAVLYAFISLIAAGVLPIEQVANRPLTEVARTILPTPLFVFFMVGGAMFALISTLNAQLSWAPKPIIQACEDGWFPAGLAKLNSKKSPWILLTIYYVVGMVPILTGFDIDMIANMVLVLNYAMGILLAWSVLNLPKVLPDQWAKSKYHVGTGVLFFVFLSNVVLNIVQIYLLGAMLTPTLLISNVAILVGSVVYVLWREKSGKVKMEVSYEDN